MLRLPHVPITRFWSSGLVLLALIGVLMEIRNLRQRRLHSGEPAGVETILTSQQLTYLAEPIDEPRRLPIDLVDRGLPLALQENYAAQPSNYHPARSERHNASLLPHPDESPLDEAASAHAEVPAKTKTETFTAPILAPPGRSEPDEIPWSTDEEKELDARDDLMMRMPPAYPATGRDFSPDPSPTEVQLSYTTSESENEMVSVEKPSRVPGRRAVSSPAKRSDSRHLEPALSAHATLPDNMSTMASWRQKTARRLFPGPTLDGNEGISETDGSQETFWAKTNWTRSVVSLPTGHQGAAASGER